MKQYKQFVIGDIHGEYQKLQDALDKAEVDYENDKVIQLGDIVDRGVDPFKCIDILLKFKNITFIRGNHDQMFIEWLEDQRNGFGGHHGSDITYRCWRSLSDEKKELYKDLFTNRMVDYHIDDKKRFYVHAGFNRHYFIADQSNTNLLFHWDRDFLLAAMSYKNMSQDIAEYPFRIKDGFKEVYVGHTPTQYFKTNVPILCGGDKVWVVDTGAGKFGSKGYVTVMDVDTKQFYQG